jgi:hypothetical protein
MTWKHIAAIAVIAVVAVAVANRIPGVAGVVYPAKA